MKNSLPEYFSSVSSAADVLRYLFPVQAMVHVGAGNGRAGARQCRQWRLPWVVFIEAHPEYRDSLLELAEQQNSWQAALALIGEQNIEVDFYETSNPMESGVVAPQQWQAIWPNLTETGCIPLYQHRLDALLAEPPYSSVAGDINWVVIDCMPAVPIIKSGGDLIRQWDVLRVRVILDTSCAGVAGSSLKDVAEYLVPHDFRCVAVTESHHPAVGEALFIRDWEKELKSTVLGIQKKQAALDTKVQSQLDRLTSALDEQTRRAVDQQSQFDLVNQQLSERNKQLAGIRGQLDVEKRARNALEQQKHELNEQLDEKKKTLAEQVQVAENRQQELVGVNSELAEMDKQLGAADAQLEELKNKVSEKGKQILGLNNQLAELEKGLARQTRIAEERQQELAGVKNELAERDKQLDAVGHQLEGLENKVSEKAKQIYGLNNQLAELEKGLASQTRIAEERQQELDQAAQDLVERDKQLSEAHNQLEELKNTDVQKEKQILELDKQLAEKETILDEKTNLIEERQREINELEVKIKEFEAGEGEMEHRQQLLDDELVKAEAQLALITDILIREKNF